MLSFAESAYRTPLVAACGFVLVLSAFAPGHPVDPGAPGHPGHPSHPSHPSVEAQAGDKPGEEQPPLPESLRLPPPEPLAPEAERATFVLPPGVDVELVAAEPLVGDPVTMAFDGDGGLWVAEMHGYMRDVDGNDEDEPIGQIARLTDTDGDGRMDERTVFIEGLILPRALLPTRGGLLYIAPPELVFAEDTDGDGAADRRRVLASGLGGIESPEHAINGLVPGMDNWIRVANAPSRYRFVGQDTGRFADAARALGHGWVAGRTAGGGQWGLSRDDEGRFFYNTNSQSLFVDLFPSWYATRNPSLGRGKGVLVRVVRDETVRPSRPTPGVNRGYQAGLLREDGTLSRFTAACSPFIHRGAAMASFHGDAFVCEPAGHLIKRFELVDQPDGRIAATDPRRLGEFLTSTDERFRPVALANGPDGALYVADMYRGVIQHRIFVTSFLRKQIEERKLEAPIGRGRIWRITDSATTDRAYAVPPPMSARSWTEVCAALESPDGWWRDMAQRTIVEEGEGDADAVELTRQAADSANPLARLHALWALEGVGALTTKRIFESFADPDPRVVRAAMRLSEPHLGQDTDAWVARIFAAAARGGARDRWQAVMTLGEVPNTTGAGATTGTAAREALLKLLARRPRGTRQDGFEDPILVDAVLSGLGGEELEFLEFAAGEAAFAKESTGRERFASRLAGCVGREERSDRLPRVLALASELAQDPPRAWLARSILEGLLDARRPGPDGRPAPLALSAPTELANQMAQSSDPALAEFAAELHGSLLWPGREDLDLPVVRPLDEAETRRFRAGRELYASICASCHQPSGRGQAGKAPALRASEWVLGDPERLVRIVRYGLIGPLEVRGEAWDDEMPGWGSTDEELAAVLTYIRREWGNGVEPVDVETVGRATRETPERLSPFTTAELGLFETRR